eukprot:1119210-Prorocentrum_minimum.AAC.7
MLSGLLMHRFLLNVPGLPHGCEGIGLDADLCTRIHRESNGFEPASLAVRDVWRACYDQHRLFTFSFQSAYNCFAKQTLRQYVARRRVPLKSSKLRFLLRGVVTFDSRGKAFGESVTDKPGLLWWYCACFSASLRQIYETCEKQGRIAYKRAATSSHPAAVLPPCSDSLLRSLRSCFTSLGPSAPYCCAYDLISWRGGVSKKKQIRIRRCVHVFGLLLTLSFIQLTGSGGSRNITSNEHWKSQIRHALYTSARFCRAPNVRSLVSPVSDSLHPLGCYFYLGGAWKLMVRNDECWSVARGHAEKPATTTVRINLAAENFTPASTRYAFGFRASTRSKSSCISTLSRYFQSNSTPAGF